MGTEKKQGLLEPSHRLSFIAWKRGAIKLCREWKML